jgi:hypothetical protein
MTINVNAEQVKTDVKEQLDKWMLKCVKKGGSGHETTHGATNAWGIGYPGASEHDPAVILEDQWNAVKAWWEKELKIDTHYNKWVIGSFGGVSGVQDLCCSCSACEPIKKRDFNSASGFSAKPRTLVYHLKVIKVAQVTPSPAASMATTK